MSQPIDVTLELAAGYRQRLAGHALTRAMAKLYSQHARLRERQPGLSGWRESEAEERLDEAVRLIEAALIEREGREEAEVWQEGLRRAGELLEWLSHPDISPAYVPTRLLAAAAYQLAGYPARSVGLLMGDATQTTESDILRYLLRADFPRLLQALAEFWTKNERPETEALPWGSPDDLSSRLQRWVAQETMSALGVLVAEMRWGDEDRIDVAVDKLSAISKFLLHGEDAYSWFLAKLCAMVTDVYRDTSMRHHLEILRDGVNETGRELLERYLRYSYQSRRILAWPSQVRGIERLASDRSFALCAPTGAGKTTVAELGILQKLFSSAESAESEEPASAPLALYLVPSRALAAEMEAKLARLVARLGEAQVIVTGLYGGTDWGPTDAWLTREAHTVLICTYEKAEALIRFLGPLFLNRISLVVVDEAHRIQFDGNHETLRNAENRSLRLEVLCARLLAHAKGARTIALSAVAGGIEQVLANWISGQSNATLVRTDYRSTRQLIGRLECLPNRRFRIHYDLLDGAPLKFEEEGQPRTPYIPEPFPQYPDTGSWDKTGIETRLRPYLFWAAMHLATEREEGHQRAVLISVPQKIGGYVDDFLELLESPWAEAELPPFFSPPTAPYKQRLWDQCLQSCEDYFGSDSREYRLLEKGIIVHHGRMPGRMARLLVELIEERIVNLVIATSTLTEGLNLPFETILVPTLRRGRSSLSEREFGNLAGRAGRPGYSTEGRTLVLLPHPLPDESPREVRKVQGARNRYSQMVEALQLRGREVSPQSPLGALMGLLREHWSRLSGTRALSTFLEWLEQTAPLTIDLQLEDESISDVVEMLDVLDSILLAAIVELEELSDEALDDDELEDRLREIWWRCYAHYAVVREADLERIFLRRSRALVERIYPSANERRRLYRTNLPPRSGVQLLDLYADLQEHLQTGMEYAWWDSEERFAYIETTIEMLGALAKFEPQEKAGRYEVDWHDVLRWWLDLSSASEGPSVKQVGNWHRYVRHNFQYRFNWGLGNFIALAIDDAFGGQLEATAIEDWPATGLPWIVIWLKELIVWGTLEPVAAYLLSRGLAVTRPEAETMAQQYYSAVHPNDADELLNASRIREWAERRFPRSRREPGRRPPRRIKVTLLRDFGGAPSKQWRVLPVRVDGGIQWVDPAGFPLAESSQLAHWNSNWLHNWDFHLDPDTGIVSSSEYL